MANPYAGWIYHPESYNSRSGATIPGFYSDPTGQGDNVLESVYNAANGAVNTKDQYIQTGEQAYGHDGNTRPVMSLNPNYVDPSIPVGTSPGDGYRWMNTGGQTFGSQNQITTPDNWSWQNPELNAQSSGGGMFGGALGSILAPITQGISSTQQNLGSSISSALNDPNFQTFAALAGGMYGAASGGLLGGAAAGDATTGNVLNGIVQSGPYAGASVADLQAANGVIASGPYAGATTADMLAANGAGTAAGGTGAAAGSGVAAATAAGAGKVATDTGLLGTIKNYAPLIGAALGAAGSGSSSTSTSSNKDPWAPAQAWMKANLGFGQQLQNQYQQNPFNQQQQQAYNNSANLGNQFRSAVNGLVPQMNNWRPYQRTPQSQTVTPYNLGFSNLGSISSPFPGA